MKTNHLIKFMLASILVIWVATGNASFTGKCKKVCTKAANTALKVKTTSAKHFSPLDVVKW